MKMVHIIFHFEYAEALERLVDSHGITEYVRYSMIESRDLDGKHFGTQVHPGSGTVMQVVTADDRVEPLLADLAAFRQQKPAHRHLQALVVPIERRLHEEL